MLTLEEIKNVTFTKTRGGYSTVEVDDFIDKCVETFAGLIEERNASNKKLEVLADKLVEYRNDEDSIRSALVNAQRLGDTIVREANQKATLIQEDAAIKAEKIMEDAAAKAANTVDGVTEEVKAQQAELERLQHEVTMFKERMLSIYKEHLSLIDLLPEEPKEEKPAEEVVVAVEEEVAEVVEEPAVVETVIEEPVAEEIAEPAAEEVEAVPVTVPLSDFANVQETVSAPFEETAEDEEEELVGRFDNLKFGDDYVISDDSEDGKASGKGGFFRRMR